MGLVIWNYQITRKKNSFAWTVFLISSYISLFICTKIVSCYMIRIRFFGIHFSVLTKIPLAFAKSRITQWHCSISFTRRTRVQIPTLDCYNNWIYKIKIIKKRKKERQLKLLRMKQHLIFLKISTLSLLGVWLIVFASGFFMHGLIPPTYSWVVIIFFSCPLFVLQT